MTRLEKYLTTSASDIIDAETTESRYFIIDHLIVRLSDHYSNNTDADMQILVPMNGGTKYSVFIKGGSRMVCWNAKEIADFIPHFNVTKMLRASVITSSPKPAFEMAKKIEAVTSTSEAPTGQLIFKNIKDPLIKKNYSKGQRDVLARSKSPWRVDEIKELSGMFKSETGKATGVNEDFQIFLSCTSCNYKEALNIFKLVCVDNKKTATIPLLQEAYALIKEHSEE